MRREVSPFRKTEERPGVIAPLLLRGAVGATLFAHGVKHARSLTGTASWFGSIGFRRPQLQATSSAVVEIGSGTALLLGFATPLAAAAGIGTMAVAGPSVHIRNGFFITAEGWEYVANMATAAAVVAGLGPGRASLDHALGFDRRLAGDRALTTAVVVGLSSAAAHLGAFYREPVTEQ